MIDHKSALDELGDVLDAIDPQSVEAACQMIVDGKSILLYGCGREALQMRGLAMRLYHLGLRAGMVGDMNAPPLGAGDLFVVSAGPGELSTVNALMKTAKRDGAKVMFFTAMADTPAARLADLVLLIPAQTMANDHGPDAHSILPMGSVYEGALFLLFEVMVLHLRELTNVSPSEMRARHTNME